MLKALPSRSSGLLSLTATASSTSSLKYEVFYSSQYPPRHPQLHPGNSPQAFSVTALPFLRAFALWVSGLS